jgi:uncharacterized oxidoreductase
MKTSGNTILITGGGTGIGRALAHRFHDLGNRVIVAGRRQDTLDEAAGGRDGIATALLDITDPAAIADFAARVTADHPALNVVIHNAGVMREEDSGAKRDLSAVEAMVATNLLGPIRLTDALVDHLGSQADAAIVTVTSGLAFVPLTNFPTYCATKAAMHSYTIALREKLRGRIEVIELAPPGVQTDLTPGQSSFEGYMPLADFTDEAMTGFEKQPTPEEIVVGRAKMLRAAERDGRFEETRRMLNASRPG